jgi:hypothetical protein
LRPTSIISTTEEGQLATEFIQNGSEPTDRSPVSSIDLVYFAEGLDDEVDGAIMKMESVAAG